MCNNLTQKSSTILAFLKDFCLCIYHFDFVFTIVQFPPDTKKRPRRVVWHLLFDILFYPKENLKKWRCHQKNSDGIFFVKAIWWRRRELNPRPKTNPYKHLRVQFVYLPCGHSLSAAPTNRLRGSVSSNTSVPTKMLGKDVHH